jgi:hypothetical protein
MIKMKNLVIISCATTLLLGAVSCKSSDTKSDNSITLKIRSLTNLKIQSPEVVITLYGYDTTLEDGAATIISQKSVALTKIPLDVEMGIPKNTASLITPKPVIPGYYLEIYGDANKNNLRDKGDLTLDAENGFSTVVLDSPTPQVFFVKPIQ